jgi:hypothetical protein
MMMMMILQILWQAVVCKEPCGMIAISTCQVHQAGVDSVAYIRTQLMPWFQLCPCSADLNSSGACQHV